MPTTVLVIGGAGYIGSVLVPTLLRAGFAVHVLDNFRLDQTSLTDCCLDPNFRVTRGDCREKHTLNRALVVFEGHAKRNFIHVRDVARAFLHAITNFETMHGKPYNVGLSDANLSKLELCAAIRKQLPGFTVLEAPVGEDPDKRDYVV